MHGALFGLITELTMVNSQVDCTTAVITVSHTWFNMPSTVSTARVFGDGLLMGFPKWSGATKYPTTRADHKFGSALWLRHR